ncbi:MAG: TonB-dependent receptor plug domain-containing protein, partial [Bacteroidota bacterium]
MIPHKNPPHRICIFILYLSLLSIFNGLFAQDVKLLDATTLLSIENVAVFNLDKTKSAVSNNQGVVNLSVFNDNEILIFQHPAYQELNLKKVDIDNDVIKLSERIIKMEDVVVSANKWEQDAAEIPNEIVSISAKEIAFNNPQTSADLLAGSGEIFVQKSQLGGGSPSLRGFAANSVLIVVDGVRMNNAIFRSGNLQNVISIDPNSLEGAEVILGPGSVIYGSDALGGVMDFHTKDPQYLLNDEKVVFGNAFTRYSSASSEKTGHLDFGIRGKRLATFSSFSYSDLGDLVSGSNRPSGYEQFGSRTFFVTRNEDVDVININPDADEQLGSEFKSWNILQKINYKPSKSLDFGYSFYLSNTSDIPRYDRLTQTGDDGTPTNAEWYYGPQRWEMHTLRATFTAEKAFFNQAKVVLAYQNYQESRNDRRFGNNRLR